jgi:hypothetical protein
MLDNFTLFGLNKKYRQAAKSIPRNWLQKSSIVEAS